MDNEAILAAIRSAELAQPRGSPKDNPRDHVWEGHMAWQGKAPKSIEAGVLYIIALLWGLKGHKQVGPGAWCWGLVARWLRVAACWVHLDVSGAMVHDGCCIP